MSKRAFVYPLMAICAALATRAQATDLYMVGHEDDWQLFMGSRAFDHIASGEQINFIYLTAGEDSYGTGGWGKIPYFRARENGALASLMAATSTIPKWYPADTGAWVTRNGHQIWTWRHRNTLSFYLRLPDGASSGNGHTASGNLSVTKFRNGVISKISAIDGSTTYTSYTDLVQTIQAILNKFEPGVAHLTDIDSSINPEGHPDHFEASYLAMNAFDGIFRGYEFWQDYNILKGPPTLTQAEIIKKTDIFAGLCHQMSVDGYNLVFESWHASFLPRGSFRQVASPYPFAWKRR